MKTTKEKVNEFEDRAIEITHFEDQRGGKITEKIRLSLMGLWDNSKRSTYCM